MDVNVYRIWPDADTYRYVSIDSRWCKTDQESVAYEKPFRFDGAERDSWSPPKLYIPNPRRPRPDIWSIGNSSAFAVTEEAYEILSMHLEMAGQLLPIQVDGENLTICNVTVCPDCVDVEQSEKRVYEMRHQPGTFWTSILTPAFFPRALPESPLFKIPNHPRREDLYCWERTGDPESEFKACVEENKLKGLTFKKVWSSEG